MPAACAWGWLTVEFRLRKLRVKLGGKTNIGGWEESIHFHWDLYTPNMGWMARNIKKPYILF